jgi:hypothetical protein
MSTRRPFSRALWLLVAALQLVLSGAAIADARVEAESIASGPTSHIEEHGGANCPRVHPEDCALCRILSTSATPAAAPAIVPEAVLRIVPASDGPVTVARLGVHAARSRAPPAIA